MCQPRCPHCSEPLTYVKPSNEPRVVHGMGEAPGRDVPAHYECPECHRGFDETTLELVAEPFTNATT